MKSRVVLIPFAILVFATVGLIMVTSPATAAMTVETNATMSDDPSSLVITGKVTISPEGSPAENITINIDETDKSFIKFNEDETFGRTVSPGGANIDIEYKGSGKWKVAKLEPNQQINITFKVYPRVISTQSINAAFVKVDYIQNGQSVDDDRLVNVDTSNSVYFKYQDEKNDDTNPTNPILLGFIGAIVGILIGGVIGYRQGNQEEDEPDFTDGTETPDTQIDEDDI